ncbi:alpha/beta fold hydrolase [Falsiroseomonas sp. HW251]|uniref:alpha/beta fold hydrolase n=1 Tax=Falsiroseomonas sp. HW251 TaxID=3390998 RepID=UPI003D30FA20
MTPRQNSLRYLLAGAFHRLAWTEWGPADGPAVVCVHGVTRSGRDFDALATCLADRGYRVLCPDLPGRGESGWLRDPMLYTPVSYVVALAHLLARLDGPVDWVGTSLGGICGMMVAAGDDNPLRRLVLNDVGSRVPAEASARIGAYMQQNFTFEDMAALEAHLRLVHAPFGALTDAQWRHLAAHSARSLPDGRLAMHYDPAIAVPIAKAPPGEVDLTPIWLRVTVPTLLLRGGDSDILDAETAAAMAQRPAVSLVTFPDIGHAPALMDAAQIQAVTKFLEGR